MKSFKRDIQKLYFLNKAWAIGSPLVQDFPQDIAYPLGGSSNEFKYFYLQMHYDNPGLIPSMLFRIKNDFLIVFIILFLDVKDNSGIRLHVTKKYRPIEFGVLTVYQYK